MISIADAIKKLEEIFDKANERFYNKELVRPVITIQTGKKSVLGWCSTGTRWVAGDEGYYEINIVAENLARSLDDVVGTMLHEMVHLYNAQNGISDCTVTQYHNGKFKEASLAHGLEMVYEKAVPNKGYAFTKLNEEGMKFVVELTAAGMKDFELNRGAPVAKKKHTTLMHTYKCECGIKIRNKSNVLNIICGCCGCKFKLQEGKKNQD